jgi:hypothetical protein
MRLVQAIGDLFIVALAVQLIAREHYIRFGWLTFSTVLALIADWYFWWVRTNHHSAYIPTRNFIFFFWFGINILIIWEARNFRKVSFPVAVQTLAEVTQWTLHYVGNLWAAYYLGLALRGTDLLMVCYWLIVFNRSPSQLRQESPYEPHG